MILAISTKSTLTTKENGKTPKVASTVTLRTFKFKDSKNKKKDRKFSKNFYTALTLFPPSYVCSILVDEKDEQLPKKTCRKRLKLLLLKAKVHLNQAA